MASLLDDDDFLPFLADFDIDDELLMMELLPDQEETTYSPDWPVLDIEELTDIQCKLYFRFFKEDLIRLVTCLQIPEKITLENRCKMTGLFCLCIFLRRMTYPNRLVDLERFFGRPMTTLSMAVNWMVSHLYQNFNHKLSDINQPWFVNRLQEYADAIHEKGAPLTNVIGFIDGTVRSMCRPTKFQRVCFNGHKRVHALKFQAVSSPDGMIVNLFGPLEGRRHDSALLLKSRLQEQFEAGDWSDRNGQKFCLYGDPAYPQREYLKAPYKGANVTAEQQTFNKQMSSVREGVEWGFGKIVQQFAFLDFKKNLKVFLQPIGQYYLIGGLMVNCHTCIYGSQNAHYFGVAPPSLEEYLV